jgi:uncharacterized membrane protein
LKEWTTPAFRNTPSTTNLEGEEIVDAPGKDGKASLQEQVKLSNPWRKMMMMMMMMMMMIEFIDLTYCNVSTLLDSQLENFFHTFFFSNAISPNCFKGHQVTQNKTVYGHIKILIHNQPN